VLRRSTVGIAVLLCSFVPFCAPAVSSTMRVTVPGGTPITVHLANEISSSTAHEGDTFSFSVVDDVRTGGWLIIPAGSQGVGKITSVENAAGNGHSGKLGLQFAYVYAVDGEKIRVTQAANPTENEQKTGVASTAIIATYALLGPAGSSAHDGMKGREASISPNTPFSVFVDQTVHVESSDHAGKTGGFAH